VIMPLPHLLTTVAFRCLALVAFVLTALNLEAQTARWHPDRGSLGVGQGSEIQLVLEGCSPEGAPALPTVPGLTLELAGTSQSTQIVNATITRRVLLNYLVRPSQRGSVRIPSFDLATDKGSIRVPAAEFEVGEATIGQTGATLDSIVQSRLNLPTTSVWVGEIFPFNYTLSVARRFSFQLGSGIEWASAPLTVEEWGKLETTESMVAGELRLNATYRSRGVARSSGTIVVKPAQQLVNLQTGTSMFGVFARPTMEQYTITTAPVSVVVKPLPSPAPAEFNGAVGEFILTSKVVPTTAAVGEPITWTLELSGTGNWPDVAGLPSRDVSRDFRVVQPQPKRTPKDNSLFESTFSEDVVLIPTRPGTYAIGPFRWTYFDPKVGQYKTLVTDRASITVTGQTPTPPSAGTTPANGRSDATSQLGTTAAQPTPRPISLPNRIPGEPIEGTAAVAVPLSTTRVWIGSALSLLGLASVWIALALMRARRTDPLRREREAKVRILMTLRALKQTGEAKSSRTLVRAWQRDALILIGVPQSAPSLGILERHLRTRMKDSAAGWLALWVESDRALYSENGNLPSTWYDRALAEAQTLRVPRFSLLSLFAPQNLLPFVAAIALLSALSSLRGADGMTFYRQGDFSAAQSAWAGRLSTTPTDWIAHHNLALSLSQQDRWGEAAAHASAAFVQQPHNEKVRWNWSLALQRAGYSPPKIGTFLAPSPLHRVAQRLSSAGWKWMLIASVWILMASVALVLARVYSVGPHWLRPAGLSLGALTLILTAVSASSLHLYGATADRRAVIVWRTGVLRSIPTEADSAQKTTPLVAGSVAVVERTFLKWHRLAFPNGQTGWVPANEVVALWSLK